MRGSLQSITAVLETCYCGSKSESSEVRKNTDASIAKCMYAGPEVGSRGIPAILFDELYRQHGAATEQTFVWRVGQGERHRCTVWNCLLYYSPLDSVVHCTRQGILHAEYIRSE